MSSGDDGSAPTSLLLLVPLDVLGNMAHFLSARTSRKVGEVCRAMRKATEPRRWRHVRLDPGGYEVFSASDVRSAISDDRRGMDKICASPIVIEPAIDLWSSFQDALSAVPVRRRLVHRLDFRPFNCVEDQLLEILPTLTDLHTLYHYHPGSFASSRFTEERYPLFNIFDNLVPLISIRTLHVEIRTQEDLELHRLFRVTPHLEVLQVDGYWSEPWQTEQEEIAYAAGETAANEVDAEGQLAQLRSARLRVRCWQALAFHLLQYSPKLESLVIESSDGDHWERRTRRRMDRYEFILKSESLRHFEVYGYVGEYIKLWAESHGNGWLSNLETLFHHTDVSHSSVSFQKDR